MFHSRTTKIRLLKGETAIGFHLGLGTFGHYDRSAGRAGWIAQRDTAANQGLGLRREAKRHAAFKCPMAAKAVSPLPSATAVQDRRDPRRVRQALIDLEVCPTVMVSGLRPDSLKLATSGKAGGLKE